jgi:hypothetical protein
MVKRCRGMMRLVRERERERERKEEEWVRWIDGWIG